jgi:ParB family transcriptional regulator, chromosome partitioning protein
MKLLIILLEERLVPSLKTKPPAVIRGVAAILGDESELPIREISLSKIDLPATQPRKYFDPQKMDQFITSVRDKGILEPIIVRTKPAGRFELVAGERRYRAAEALKLVGIPVVIKEFSDLEVLEVALIENLQREDLNPIEEVEGVLQLLGLKFNISSGEVVSLLNRKVNEHLGKVTSNVTGNDQLLTTLESLGISNWLSFATNKLPLLNLPNDILEVLRQGSIEYTKAKAISKIKDIEQRQNLLAKAITDKLSLNQIREEVLTLQDPKQPSSSIQAKIAETLRLARKAKLNAAKQRQLEKYLDQIRTLLEK